MALLDAGEGILGHRGENGPLWGTQGLESFTREWGTAGKFGVGRSPVPAGSPVLYQEDMLGEVSVFPL